MLNSAAVRSSLLLRTTLTKFISRTCVNGCNTRVQENGPTKLNAQFPVPSSVHNYKFMKQIELPNLGIFVPKEPVKVIIDKRLPSISDIVIEKSDLLPTWLNIVPLKEPTPGLIQDKQCARLIKIRRRKMRIHKLKKLRKRFTAYRMKMNQKRNNLKKNAFETEMFGKIDSADSFDAEKWVQEMVTKAYTDPQTLIPKEEKKVRPTVYVFPAPSKRR